jgi:undecaprenyl-phosphate galactose phosphotransferase
MSNYAATPLGNATEDDAIPIAKSAALKRPFDIVFSCCALLFLAPLFLMVACAIGFFSSGPIFFASVRLGKKGKHFHCWKFRTMHLNADDRLHKLLEERIDLKEQWETYCKLKKDPRVTTIGKWLRKTSLDELPQFWNVLKGTLSVVGPRPYLPHELEALPKELTNKILSVRPGITGIWQTSGRNALSFEKRLELDARYIDRQSLGLDLWLICKTIPLMLFPKGAY